MSIVLAEINTESEKKYRTVIVYKEQVFKDIDLFTHKHVDASQSLQDPRSRNAVSSDVMENVDGAVIARCVEFRYSKLRNRLQFALVDRERHVADDHINLELPAYRFDFMLPTTFDDNNLRPLAEFIHRFLVFGALYDWYSQFGMTQQAAIYGSELDELEEEINSTLRGPSIVKRPLQPFGPAK